MDLFDPQTQQRQEQLELAGLAPPARQLTIDTHQLIGLAVRLRAAMGAQEAGEYGNGYIAGVAALVKELSCAAGDAVVRREDVLQQVTEICQEHLLPLDGVDTPANVAHNRAVRGCIEAVNALRREPMQGSSSAASPDTTGCLDWLTSRGTLSIHLVDGRMIDVCGADVAQAVQAFRFRTGDLPLDNPPESEHDVHRRRLHFAALSCPHAITDEMVILYRQPGQDGNALRQLAGRLAAAVPPVVPQAVRAAVERMSTPLDASRLSGATAEADARCMAIIKAFTDSLDAASATVAPAR